jgi:two-component system response regulator YesN
MYRILLVEDEIIIRKGIKCIISKMNLDIENIYEADNGKTAIEACKKFSPHIIITDIKMPGMDGLEFIDHIKKINLKPRFIILTGYSEFSYAQKAISYGVSEYLLKPIKKKYLYNILCKLIKEFEDEKAKKLKNAAGLQKVLIWDVLQGQYKSNEIAKILNDAGIVFTENNFFILSLYMNPNNNYSIDDGINYVIENSMGKFFRINFFIQTNYNYNIFLVNMNKNNIEKFDLFITALEMTLQDIFKKKDIVIQIGISETGTQVELLPDLLKQAEAALDFKALFYTPKVHIYSRIKKGKSFRTLPVTFFESICSAITKGNKDYIVLAIHNLFNDLLRIDNVTPDIIINTIKSLENFIISTNKNLYIEHMNKIESENSVEFLYRTSDNIKDFISRINNRLLLLSDQISSTSELKNCNPIDYAINYIDKNYNKDLNLIFISNIVSMNSNYFSTLFKKKTGLSFINYLQTVRIEKSKILLMEHDAKIYEIASEVGYSDDKYYCKVFKTITGLTPTEYRMK